MFKSIKLSLAVFALSALAPLPASARLHSGISGIYGGPAGDGACVVLADGSISCWGNGFNNPQSPVKINGQKITSAAIGDGFACALLADTTVWCWGANGRGQLGNGDGTFSDSRNPVIVGTKSGSINGFTAIAVGHSHACATRSISGVSSVWCWGDNQNGQLGNFNASDDASGCIPTGSDCTRYNAPLPVVVHVAGSPQLTGIEQLSLGNYHSCAQLNDGSAACWGDNWWGQVGNSYDLNSYDSPQTVVVPGGPLGFQKLIMQDFTLTAGGQHTCGLTTEGSSNAIACWGLNFNGEIGNGQTGTDGSGKIARSPTPDAVVFPDGTKLKGLRSVIGGGTSTCAILDDHTAACWGADNSGQLGDNGSSDKTSPVPVVDPSGNTFQHFSQIVGGNAHFCASLTDGVSVYCWGDNSVGQLGTGDVMKSATPHVTHVDTNIFVDDFETNDP